MALLSWINWLDRAGVGISSSSAAGDLVAGRLATPQLRAFWRTVPGVVTPTLTVDLGATREVGVIALAQPDTAGGVDADGFPRGLMATTDTVRHRLDVLTPGDGALLDTGAIAGGWAARVGMHAHVPAAPINARHWVCDLNAASLAGVPGWIDLGRAWIGPAWVPSLNFAYGWSRRAADGGTVRQNPRSGLEFPDRAFRQRVLGFAFNLLSAADEQRLAELQDIAGSTRQILFLADPAKPEESRNWALGYLTQVQPITNPYFRRFAVAFEIRHSL
jgi:hypothetical protein